MLQGLAVHGLVTGASAKQVTALVFGRYAVDSDHPWHQVERGEIILKIAREDIMSLGREQGLGVDIWDVLLAMAENGGGLREELVDYVPRIRAAGLVTSIITNNVVEFGDHWRNMLPVEELYDYVVDCCEVGIR